MEDSLLDDIANGDTDDSAYPKKRPAPAPNKVAKMIDNKRAKLEKPLSALQRDQIMVRLAKDELEVKNRTQKARSNLARGLKNGRAGGTVSCIFGAATGKRPFIIGPGNSS